ncbi:MAG: outer membrane lipoprotein carrier protein LolA [Pseudomonadota bacterium]
MWSGMLVACVLAVGPVQAAEPPAVPNADALLARLHQPAVLRGSFVQSRQIQGFKRPVESSGDFVVARDQGLLWHTVKPFESLLSVSRERLRVNDGSGGAETTIDARREPMLRTLNEILQNVVIADARALQLRFDIGLKLVGTTGWQMTLVAKDATLRSRFPQIELSGDAHVQGVRLAEASGDVTTVRFENQREDTHLTEAETGKLK